MGNRVATVTNRSELEMGRFTGAGVVLLALLLAMSAPYAHARSSGAKVVVPEYRHDFGDIFAGQFMDHVFTIRNEGTVPLTLSDVVPATLKSSLYSPAGSPTRLTQVNVSPGFVASNVAIRRSPIPLAPIAARLTSGSSPEPVPT